MPSRPGLSIAWIAGPVTYLILEAVAASAFPHYSYAHNLISDLGASASPRSAVMNIAFCIQGTLFLVGALFFSRARLFLTFATENALGNILVAIFHRGVPAHGVGAVLAIVGGNAAILAGSRVGGPFYRKVSIALGVFGLLSFLVFAVVRTGVWERCSVYSILSWQLLTAVGVLWSRLDQ